MLTGITIAPLDDLIAIYPKLSHSESLELATRYHTRVNKVMEQVAGEAVYEGVSAVSQDVVEQRVADMMARRLEDYREATSSALTRFTQEGSADKAVEALNTVLGRLTGFREFIRHQLPTSVNELERVRQDTRIEVLMEDTIRRFSKELWRADAGMLNLTHNGWELLPGSLSEAPRATGLPVQGLSALLVGFSQRGRRTAPALL